MAYNVKILPTAEQEVDDIVDYLMGHGIFTARHFLDKYRSQLQLLQSGVVDYGLSKLPELAVLGYHACLVNSYVMLYYYDNEDVVIAHVFHQSQDYAALVISRNRFELLDDDSKEPPGSTMPSERFLFGWGNGHRDLRHVGCGVVANDVVDKGDLARGPGGCQVVFVHIAE